MSRGALHLVPLSLMETGFIVCGAALSLRACLLTHDIHALLSVSDDRCNLVPCRFIPFFLGRGLWHGPLQYHRLLAYASISALRTSNCALRHPGWPRRMLAYCTAWLAPEGEPAGVMAQSAKPFLTLLWAVLVMHARTQITVGSPC